MLKMTWGSYQFLVTILLSWSVKLILISKANAALNPEEENALEVLRVAVHLPTWKGDPCQQTWVQCSNNSALNTVLALKLGRNNLTGTVPPDIAKFRNARDIEFHSNHLTGPIPDISNMTDLTTLYLSNNQWDAGPIPDMSQLSALAFLDARSCNFQGAIPALENNRLLQTLRLQLNNLTSIPSDLRNLTSSGLIDVHGNNIIGELPELPSTKAQLFGMQLYKIDFSDNSFTGEIPGSWEFLTAVQQMDLRNNRLSGIVPEWLVGLPALQSLSLENNSFTGIPFALATKKGLNISMGNITIVFGNETSPGSPLSTGGIVGIVGAALFTAGILLVMLLLTRRRTYKPQIFREDMPKSAQAFSLKQIKAMTQNYKKLIGKGGFGPVYYGRLPNGKEVAVKVKAMDSKQGANEFLNEVRLLSRLHHRNLVPLIGYCLEAEEQILVYAYMSQGSLYNHLHRLSESSFSQVRDPESPTFNALDWKTRLDIAINSARGLEYLHKDCNPPVIHRDVKSSNILLTDKLEAKFGDLGISKQLQALEPDPEEELNITGITTAIKGTLGYLDPEYVTQQRLTTKSDVFSFGMILLEIVAGKRAQSLKFPDSDARTLKEWVEGALDANNVRSIVDPVLNGKYNEEGILLVVRLALSCLRPTGAERPDMGEVVRILIEAFQLEKKFGNESGLEVGDETTVQLSGQLSIPYNADSPYLSSLSVDAMEHPSWNTNPR